MTKLLPNVSSNNQAAISQASRPVVRNVENTDIKQTNIENKTQSVDKKDYYSNKTILGSLMGLATIGGGIFLIKKRAANSAKLNNKISLEQITARIEETNNKINILKNLIKEDYTIRCQFQKEKFIASLDLAGEPFDDGRELQNKINVLYDKYQKIAEPSNKVIQETKLIIKEKLKTLGQDPDFMELRNRRKSLIKVVKTSKSEDEIKIANNKIYIINDLIINKVYPEEAATFIDLYGIEESQIRKLVDENFAKFDDFIARYDSMKTVGEDFNYDVITHRFHHKNKLRFIDVFPKEADLIAAHQERLKKTSENLYYYKNLKQSYVTFLRNFAESYRKTEAVAELKSLVKQLNSLKNSLKNAA